MPDSLSLQVVLGMLLGGSLAAGVALYRGMRGRTARRQELAALEKELRDLQRKSLESHSQLHALRNSEMAKEEMVLFFVVTLPDLVRHLTSNREKRHVAPFLLQMLDVVFEPSRICLFYKAHQGQTFRMAAHKGLPAEITSKINEAGIKGGPLDVVASQQRVMTQQDMVRHVTGTADPIQEADIYAPMVDPDTDSTLGIITLSGISKNTTYATRLLKMISGLGSLALKNTEYFRYIQRRAHEDGLTGLLTKSFGLEQLSLAIHTAEAGNTDLAVLILDVDHFKKYNDTRGHLAGDRVLKRLGEIVRECIRSDDFAIRFGGEEFIVVCQDADKRGGLLAAEKIRQRIEKEAIPFQNGPGAAHVTISGGVSSLLLDSRSSVGLIGKADEALYAAKRAGRNRVLPYREAYFSGEMEPHPLEDASDDEASGLAPGDGRPR